MYTSSVADRHGPLVVVGFWSWLLTAGANYRTVVFRFYSLSIYRIWNQNILWTHLIWDIFQSQLTGLTIMAEIFRQLYDHKNTEWYGMSKLVWCVILPKLGRLVSYMVHWGAEVDSWVDFHHLSQPLPSEVENFVAGQWPDNLSCVESGWSITVNVKCYMPFMLTAAVIKLITSDLFVANTFQSFSFIHCLPFVHHCDPFDLVDESPYQKPFIISLIVTPSVMSGNQWRIILLYLAIT